MNLSQYIKHLLFLENIKDSHIYDYIIIDPSIDVSDIDLKSTKKQNCVSLKQQPINQVLGEIYYYLQKAKNPLLILDGLSVNQLNPLLQDVTQLTILNATTGLSSFGSKTLPETNDLEYMLHYGFDVVEPFDFISFIQLLNQKSTKKYIRITSSPLEGKLFDNQKLVADAKELGIQEDLEIAIVDKEDITQGDQHQDNSTYIVDKDQVISFTHYGFAGHKATVLFPGSYLAPGFQAANLLQPQDIFFDLFGIVNYNFTLTPELQKSLHETEYLIIILDQKASLLYQSLIKAKLFDAGLYETQVDFIYPQYKDLKTIVDEYKMDQVGFDQIGLARKIGSLLQ